MEVGVVRSRAKDKLRKNPRIALTLVQLYMKAEGKEFIHVKPGA